MLDVVQCTDAGGDHDLSEIANAYVVAEPLDIANDE